MASFIYNEAKRMLFAGELDLNADDMRLKMLMTNTTADTENDGIVNLSDFTTLDEMDGANYAVKALTTETVSKDDANDRAEFDCDDITYTSLGAGTRGVAGFLLYKYVDGTPGNDIAVAWIEQAATPDGSNFTIQINAEGLLQLT